MADSKISEQQIANIVELVTKSLAESEGTSIDGANKLAPSGTVQAEKKRPGRPQSQYKGNLNLRVFKEDETWFRNLAQHKGIERGMLFNILRQRFDETGGLP